MVSKFQLGSVLGAREQIAMAAVSPWLCWSYKWIYRMYTMLKLNFHCKMKSGKNFLLDANL